MAAGDRMDARARTGELARDELSQERRAASERDHIIQELYDANRRLSGTLRIILDTLDTHDVRLLFNRVAAEIRDLMGATGVVVYTADDDQFRLQSRAGEFERATLCISMGAKSGLARIAAKNGSTLRLRLAPLTTTDLRQGEILERELFEEETGRSWRVPAEQLPPYRSFLLAPVYFAETLIAFIIVGWTLPRPAKLDDARLLDAITQYLSAQMMAGLSDMKALMASRLDRAAAKLHDTLSALEDFRASASGEVEACLSHELNARVVRVEEGSGSVELIAPAYGSSPAQILDFPLGMEALYAGSVPGSTTVVPITADSAVGAWLREHDLPCVGAFADAGAAAAGDADVPAYRFMVLRAPDRGHLNRIELDFLRRVLEDGALLARGVKARDEDRRISQALMTGMRNELHSVDGITAQGLYSSATADAFVGGDFYDLIRLPEHRFCVVMGDVSGKGVEAASMSAAVRTAIGAYAWVGLGPAQMVRSLNDFLLGFSRLETFATLFVGIGDLAAGTLTYCSAGHPPALLLTASKELDVLEEQSGVVGAFEDMEFHDGLVKLSVGDTLLLYTDGATEARSVDGAFFGEDALRETVLRLGADTASPTELLEGLLETLDTFTSTHLEDDIALVAIRVDETGLRG